MNKSADGIDLNQTAGGHDHNWPQLLINLRAAGDKVISDKVIRKVGEVIRR